MRARLVLALTLIAAAAGVSPAIAYSPKCDQCSDLPGLYQELEEQEFLRDWFRSSVSQGAPYWSPADQLNAAIRAVRRWTAGRSAGDGGVPGGTDGGVPSSSGRQIDVELATNLQTCGLGREVPVTGPDGGVVRNPPTRTRDQSGSGVTETPGDPVTKFEPMTEADVKKKYCSPVADYILKHEGVHQAACRNHTTRANDPAWAARNDADAYQAGVGSLRESIAELAKRCGWPGSINKYKPDGTRVVPTPAEIDQLKNNTASKAGSLKRGTK